MDKNNHKSLTKRTVNKKIRINKIKIKSWYTINNLIYRNKKMIRNRSTIFRINLTLFWGEDQVLKNHKPKRALWSKRYLKVHKKMWIKEVRLKNNPKIIL